MEPYATAAQPGPLNGNRSMINGTDSFLSRYKYWFIGGFTLIMIIVIATIAAKMMKKKKKRGRRPRGRRRPRKRPRRRRR